MTPLIEVPEMGWDFEQQRQAKTIDEHLADVPQRIITKWGRRWAFLDLKLIDETERLPRGIHPVDWIFAELSTAGALCIPVTGFERDAAYRKAIARVAKRDAQGICVRAPLEQAARATFGAKTDELLSELGLGYDQAHLILDLDAPSFEPLEGFTKMAMAVIKRIPQLNAWRTFSIIGTAFPKTMGELKIGVQMVKRSEWLFYKELIAKLPAGARLPSFGDYGIAHPEVLQMDMRLVQPAASIRYTVDDAWFVIKGTNLRKNGNKQYVDHCRKLIDSTHYLGRAFSAGDEHIQKCADRQVSPGNLPVWRRVGTNHHIEKVVCDLASLHGA